jgi:uncharacterized protein (TIGR03083 family)
MERALSADVVRRGSAAVAHLAGEDPIRQVPACPGWSLLDLAVHLGSAHGWGAAVLASGVRSDPPTDPAAAPAAERLAWMRAQGDAVAAALGACDPDENCWTFGAPRTAAFWVRRMACETEVHRWDAVSAVGETSVLDPRVAAEGLDELLAVFFPRMLRDAGHAAAWLAGGVLLLEASDGSRSWIFGTDDAGAVVTPGARTVALTLHASPSELYLWGVNRIPLAEVAHAGDDSVGSLWQATMRF